LITVFLQLWFFKITKITEHNFKHYRIWKCSGFLKLLILTYLKKIAKADIQETTSAKRVFLLQINDSLNLKKDFRNIKSYFFEV